ncbi:AbrB/MazE/SpoVT family DNA-binding domain-containing protein [Acidianus infernus]|uniref:AbrB/MazE/SpoVT family DNA-binding domain-containing protein n=1 Tax=Acidianus infernus TaxID=12915 RepID=UPI003592F631
MGKEFILTIDDRGRITIPKEVREVIKSRKLKLRVEDSKIVLEPIVVDVDKYYGIFRKDFIRHISEFWRYIVLFGG